MDLDIDVIAASESKASGQKFIMQNLNVRHVFSDARDHAQGVGKCLCHNSATCSIVGTVKLDYVVSGLCCHAFTRQR